MPNNVRTAPWINRSLKFEEVPGDQLWWRNMQGAATQVSPAGKRSFAIALSTDFANELIEEGWTCVAMVPRSKNDPESEILPRFKISMNFHSPTPPKVYVASSDGKRRTLVDEAWLDEQNIDARGIEWIDISVNPYNWSVNGKEGCSAYLSEMVIKLDDGAFASKYAEDVPF